jgi:hypothetical protein
MADIVEAAKPPENDSFTDAINHSHEALPPLDIALANDTEKSVEVDPKESSSSFNNANHSPSSASAGKKVNTSEAFVFMQPDEGTPAAEALAGEDSFYHHYHIYIL